MKSISKSDEKRRDALIEALTTRRNDLAALIEAANAAIAEANRGREDYNEALEGLRGFAADMASEIENYAGDRSDNWRDGDRGAQFAEWQSAWESFGPEDVEEYPELEAPPEDDADDSPAEELRNIPTTPDEY